MPAELRSPIKHHVVLHRINSEKRNRGRMATDGQELVEIFPDELEAWAAIIGLRLGEATQGLLGLMTKIVRWPNLWVG